ncbi:MAG: hypothetical protein JRJ27_16545 [Deltaproteobacteria bacterium]|nr:hypothetical protein [Deltaproteobacteria bacterium]
MILKPQDLLVMLKLVARKNQEWTYNGMAVDLIMSPSEVHAAVKRSLRAGLAIKIKGAIQANHSCLEEFIVHGLKYVFMPDRGGIIRGIPTIYSIPPLNKLALSNDPIPVWPDSMGEKRGESFSPLYTSAPRAARNDSKLYELLVLVDAIRGGRARERELAIKEIRRRLSP